MNLFRKLFGRSENPGPAAKPAGHAAPAVGTAPEPVDAPRTEEPLEQPMVRIYDAYGREQRITKEEWRANHRAKAIREAWDRPDELYAIVAGELADGCANDVIDAIARYEQIATDKARGAVLHGVSLFELGRFEQAAAVFESYVSTHGDNAVILTNLARVRSRLGQEASVQDLLWRAVQADPNFEPALSWLTQSARDREGDAGVASCIRRVAVIPGSWRAQLWLARLALQDGDAGSALALYKLVLSKVEPKPTEMLVQISGDLGQQGRLEDAVQLVAPHFVPAEHGLLVGVNLIRAYFGLGHFEEARALLEALFKLGVPGWKAHLDQWQKRLDDESLKAAAPLESGSLELWRAPLEGPLWAMKREGFDAILPRKEQAAPRIGVISPSFTFASLDESDLVAPKREGAEGVFGRSLALHLAEQVHLGTSARGVAIFMRVAGDSGFVLASAPFPTEQAVSLAGGGEEACSHVFNVHVDTTRMLWRVTLQFIDVASGQVLGQGEGACSPDNPERTFRNLAAMASQLVVQHAGASLQEAPAWAGPLSAAAFRPQMLARTQALDVVVASMTRAHHSGLLGERQIFDSLLMAALDQPLDPVPRLLLITALARHRETGSPLFREYEARLRRLVAENPQDNPAAPYVLAALDGLFGRRA